MNRPFIFFLSLIVISVLLLFQSYGFSATTLTSYNNHSSANITGRHNSQEEDGSVKKEHSEADPYKIHKEYINEPWRLSSSYKVLEKTFISLTVLNILLFCISSLRKWRYYKNIKGTNIDSIHDKKKTA